MLTTRTGIALAIAVLLVSFPVLAGDPDESEVTYSISDASGPPGGSVVVEMSIDNNVDLDGWSFSICHDGDVVTPVDTELLVDGPWMFENTKVSEDGVQCIVVSSVATDGGVTADEDTPFLEIEYDLIGASGASTDLDFCDTVGDPPVETMAVIAAERFDPTFESGSISLDVNDGPFTFTLPSSTVGFSSATGAATFTVRPTIVEDEDNDGFPTDTYGFSLAIEHDAKFLLAASVGPSDAVSDMNDGDGPEFFVGELMEDGLTLGVVYSLEEDVVVLAFEEASEVAEIEYDTNEDTFEGMEDPVLTDLTWSEGLGDPVVENLIVVSEDGDVAGVFTVDGTVTLVPGLGEGFIRGDCTIDGNYNLGDPIALLGHLFRETGPRDCEDACDTNDDGELTLGDAIQVLSHQFSDGAEPEPPFPDCGEDEEKDELVCELGDDACG